MTRLRLSLLAVVLTAATACGAIKDAMTSHVDVVARVGSQELTVTQLAEMMAAAPQVPIRADVARTIAQLWVNYQLLGVAASKGDTLGTVELANQGMWSTIEQMRLTALYEQHALAAAAPDSIALRAAYEAGELLGAAHILISKQPEGLGTAANDSLRREAEAIARTVTSATFARVASTRSTDPGSKDRGGDYGVFPPGTMVPEFEAGIRSVAPGSITGVVETQFGYHVIRRSTWNEIKDQFAEQYASRLTQRAESTFFAGAEEGMNIQVKAAAPRLVKAIAEDIDAFRDDRTTIATSRKVDLTAGRMARWMAAFPPQSQIRPQLMEAPDSLIPQFVVNIMRNELLLKRADSLNIQPDSATMTEARAAFWGAVGEAMTSLNLAPAQLADTTDTESARGALAASRASTYLQALVKGETQFVEVPEQVALVLRERFEWRVVPAGVDRALAEATRLRAVADSTAGATQPPSAVPMPAPTP